MSSPVPPDLASSVRMNRVKEMVSADPAADAERVWADMIVAPDRGETRMRSVQVSPSFGSERRILRGAIETGQKEDTDLN